MSIDEIRQALIKEYQQYKTKEEAVIFIKKLDDIQVALLWNSLKDQGLAR